MKISKIMIRWFFTYILIAVIPFSACLGIYFHSRTIVAEEQVNTHRVFLGQLSTGMDKRFAETDRLLFSIKGNQQLISLSFSSSPLTSQQIYSMHELTESLNLYQVSNDFIEDIAIYFPRCQSVVCTTGKYDTLTYYSRFVDAEKYTYHSWLSALKQTEQTRRQEWPMLYERLNSGTRKNDTVLIVRLNSNYIPSTIHDAAILKSSSILITDDRGSSVFAQGPETGLLEKLSAGGAGDGANVSGFLYTTITSSVNGWNYAFLTPYAQVVEKTRGMLTFMLGLFGLTMVAYIISAYFASRAQYKPLGALMSRTHLQVSDSKKETEYELLGKHIEHLNTSNLTMEEKLQRQGLELGMDNLRKLLRGTRYASDLDAEVLQQYGIAFGGASFLVVIIAFSDTEDAAAYQPQTEQLLGSVYPGAMIYVLPVDDRLCCVLNFTEPDSSQHRERLELIQNELVRESGHTVWLAVSSCIDSFLRLSMAYGESEKALETRTMNEQGGVVFYDDSRRHNEFGEIYYPNAFDSRFINVLCSGDEEMMRSCLDEIMEKNLSSEMTAKQCEYLGFHLCMSCLKAARECQTLYGADLTGFMEEAIRAISIESVSELYDHYHELFSRLAAQIDRSPEANEGKLLERIRKCVQENYSDPSVNVNTIAELLSMNASYLSRSFGRSGETLSGYLQRMRIAKAAELLEGDMPIADIVTAVGYTNMNTFTRAFKKEKGITPGLYRNMQGHRGED